MSSLNDNILTNKRYRSYTKLSRYEKFPIYYNTEDDKWSYGRTAWLDNSSSYTTHVVEQGDTWDSLALYYYNNPTMYWILCDANRVVDSFVEPEVGKVIRVPSISAIIWEGM